MKALYTPFRDPFLSAQWQPSNGSNILLDNINSTSILYYRIITASKAPVALTADSDPALPDSDLLIPLPQAHKGTGPPNPLTEGIEVLVMSRKLSQ